jgi:hypothetical protein
MDDNEQNTAFKHCACMDSVPKVWICLLMLYMNSNHPDHLSAAPAFYNLQVQVMPCK